jgi:hypothetical protein
VVTEPRLVLLASPLLGPAVWAPVAELLRARGWSVVVPPAYRSVSTPDDVLAHLLGSIPTDTPVVLVPHSNAGLYAAALAAERDVRGIVFVDAGLPADVATTPAAPAEFRAFLAGLADERGLLPVWTTWWAGEDLTPLFGGPEREAAVVAEQQRLPLTYFDAEVPSPPGWRDLPAAYLAFGETYAAERARAEVAGWPTATLTGEHLHPLAEPDEVVDALLGLLGRLGPFGT